MGTENELRIDTASSIYDDISTLAGSVIYAGESDTSTVQEEVPVHINDDESNSECDDIKVEHVLQQFNDVINYHNNDNEDKKSLRSISTSYVSHKTSRQEGVDDGGDKVAIDLPLGHNHEIDNLNNISSFVLF